MPPDPATADPFFVQFEFVRHSVHLLPPFLSSTSPPLSAIISDIGASGGGCQVDDDLGLPHYILSTTSARFTSLVLNIQSLIAHVKTSITTHETCIQIPGLAPFDRSTIPPPFFIPNHIFTNNVISSSLALQKATGILSNTFRAFEPETIEALTTGKVKLNLPLFLPIRPLQPHKLEIGNRQPWLDQQPPKSVVYVSFGNRTALSIYQIEELAKGLEQSGWRFLWVMKSKIVDKEDNGSVEELVDESFTERTKKIGMVVKGWVDQETIMSHPATGGFVSHCGWNSVMEAVARGVPVVAWPQIGDQKVNDGVLEAARVGVWEKGWGWLGEKVVKGEEIAEKVKMVMGDDKLRERARKLGEEASDISGNKVLSDDKLRERARKLGEEASDISGNKVLSDDKLRERARKLGEEASDISRNKVLREMILNMK